MLWDTDELITSMDCVIIWRPWWGMGDKIWKPVTEGLHIDQNPFKKSGLQCVQGMVPLLPVTKETGGLAVVPRSHTEYVQDIVRRDHPEHITSGDFCKVSPEAYKDCSILVEANPGDLILWDSRLIHGGVVGSGRDENDANGLARCAITVCMVPREWATEDVQKARYLAWSDGEGMTHWPHEANMHDFKNSGGRNITWTYMKVELNDMMKKVF